MTNSPFPPPPLVRGGDDQPGCRTAIVVGSGAAVPHAVALAAAWPGAVVVVPRRWAHRVRGGGVPVRELATSLGEELPGLFASHHRLVFFLAAGAVVRLIAPLLRSKFEDPAVVVVDPAGRYAVALLSGHLGGANDLARETAALLGGEAVITTASDTLGVPAVDLLGRELGWRVEAPAETLRRAAAHVVNGDPVALLLEADGEPEGEPWRSLPPSFTLHTAPLPPDSRESAAALLWVTWRSAAAVARTLEGFAGPVVLYRPPPERGLVLGVGCDRDTSRETVAAALATTLARHGLAPGRISALATIDRKGDEPALLALAQSLGLPLQLFTPQRLAPIPVPNPSATVLRHVGVGSVAEAAALLAAGHPHATLVVEKTPHRGPDGRNVTLALARPSPPAPLEEHP